MNSVQAANQEEAAATAAEFLSSLDNLPNEVQFLLSEIKHKETRVQEINQEIQKETTRYIRHALKGSNISKDAKENGKDKDTKDKDALIPARVTALYAEIDELSHEKIALANRLVNLLTRVNARLDHDLMKVMLLSGEQPTEHYEVKGGYVVGITPIAPTASTSSMPSASTLGGFGRGNAAEKVSESLRAALANEVVSTSVVAAASPSAAGAPPQKRRRIGAAAATPTSTSRAHTPQARSRLAQQVHPSPRGRRAQSAVGDEDAEGEDDADGDADKDDREQSGDPEDEELYCFCQEKSYGEMIGCDNDNCKYQWFHLACVGLSKPLPESWYCDDCMKSLNVGPVVGSGRRGRKRQ